MKFNESKCSVLHIGKDNPKNNYMMGHTPLKVVEKERDLGVFVSAGDTLCWEEQIRVMIEKAKQMTSWIIRNVVSRKPELLIPFYKAFVRPHLEYTVQVWAPTARHGNWGIMEIEDCQRQFTWIIEGMGLLSYRQNLQRLRLRTLLEHRMRGDLIETFKIINGFVNYGHIMFGTNTAYRTRNFNVTSHHPLRSPWDQHMTSLTVELSNIGTSCHYACENQEVSTPLRLVLTSVGYLNLIRLMDSGNYRKKSLIE